MLKRTVRMTILVMLLSTGIVGFRSLRGLEANDSKMIDPKVEVDAFLSVDDYQKLEKILERWGMEHSEPVRRQLVIELLRRMRSTRELNLDNYADLIIGSRIAAGRMIHPGHGVYCVQDIFLESGRCAWAIEVLLRCKLPHFTVKSIKDITVHEENVRNSCYKVVESMIIPERTKSEPFAR